MEQFLNPKEMEGVIAELTRQVGQLNEFRVEAER